MASELYESMDGNTTSREHKLQLEEVIIDVSLRNEWILGEVDNTHRYVSSFKGVAKRCGIDIADLEQEAMIGLIEAANRYRPERGVKFSTYAWYWIKAYVHSALRKTPIVARSKNYRQLRNRITDEVQKAERDGSGMTMEEAGIRMGTSKKMLVYALEADQSDVPLESNFKRSKQAVEFLARPADQEEKVLAHEITQRLTINQQQAILGVHVWGYTNQELADKYSVSRQAINDRIQKAKKSLQNL